MSGGVDSSVAAALMVDEGHEVIGLTMRLYDASGDEQRGRGGTCCSPAEVDLARRACVQLSVPHYVVDERERFTAEVIDPFVRDYIAGRTPNPCTRCNQHIKFGPLLARASALGADVMVTGHYARLDDGALRRGADPSKDQSYFLFAMGDEARRRVRFPLGSWTKEEVRAHARARGLPAADAADSQELCFVPGGDHGAVVERRAAQLGLSAEAMAPGPVVDETGEVVGDHDGIHRVTIGQRRGFRTRGTERRYVLSVLPASRTLVVGAERGHTTSLQIGELQRLSLREDSGTRRALVQVRHRGTAEPATIRWEGTSAVVDFDPPVDAAAPGQAAVVYDGDEVLAGGWITAVR
jgi:tRNA-specific 2-thiouridylase